MIGTLSSTAWTDILCYLETCHILNLWMTGSSVIHRRLGWQGGWKELRLGTNQNPPYCNKWPRLLLDNLAGLRGCHIVSPFPKVIHLGMDPSEQDIVALPKFLTHLKLELDDGIRNEQLALLPRTLEALCLPRNVTLTPSGLREYLTQSVQTLELNENPHFRKASSLPRSLHSFLGNTDTMKPYSSLGDDLPPNLTNLHLTCLNPLNRSWFTNDLKCLRCNLSLLSLSISPMRTSKACQFRIVLLPPNLTSLELMGRPILSESTLVSLPASLMQLRLLFAGRAYARWTDGALSSLPTSLTHLEVRSHEDAKIMSRTWQRKSRLADSSYLTPECLVSLPRSLEVLRLPKLVSPVGSPFTHYDPLATSTKEIKKMANKYLATRTALLPPSLQVLEIVLRLPQMLIYPNCRYVPKTMKRVANGTMVLKMTSDLQGGGLDAIVKPSVDATEATTSSSTVPATEAFDNILQRFDVKSFPMEHIALSDKPITRDFGTLAATCVRVRNKTPTLILSSTWISLFAPYALRHLELAMYFDSRSITFPSTLTHLSITTKFICDEHLERLPPSLQILELHGSSEKNLLTDRCLRSLPHSISSLIITYLNIIQGVEWPFPPRLTNLNTKSFSNEKRRDSEEHEFAPVLPKWLQTYSTSSAFVHDSLFSDTRPAPFFLTDLRIYNPMTYFTGALLPLLPATLTVLYTVHFCLKDEDVHNIPRSLIKFRAPKGCQSLSLRSASDWPPYLQKLTISGELFCEDTLKKLPTTLRYLYLDDALLRQSVKQLRGLLGSDMEQFLIGNKTWIKGWV